MAHAMPRIALFAREKLPLYF